MRRVAWILVASGLAVAALAPTALGDDAGSYIDHFDQSSYSGSNGTLPWGTPWVEVGESDGPAAGSVRVVPDAGCKAGHCLRIASALLELQQAGAARFADTSIFATATLSFEMVAETLGLGDLIGALAGASLSVEVTVDSGAKWKMIYQGSLLDLLDPGAKVLSLDPYLSTGFGVRFLAQDLLGGEVMIDDVEVVGAVRPPPTTTTPTTVPATTPTTTTVAAPTSTSGGGPGSVTTPPTTLRSSTTSTTQPPRETTTSTSLPAVEPAPPAGGGSSPSDGPGGLRASASGLQASADLPSFRPIGLVAGQRSGVERIASEWLNLVSLALVVSGFSVAGVDRRRRSRSRTTGEPPHSL